MAKQKSSGGSGLRKNHGPKRHLHHELKPLVHEFGKLGLLTKYYSEESWILACQARGVRNPNHSQWLTFSALPTKKAKDDYFKALKKE